MKREFQMTTHHVLYFLEGQGRGKVPRRIEEGCGSGCLCYTLLATVPLFLFPKPYFHLRALRPHPSNFLTAIPVPHFLKSTSDHILTLLKTPWWLLFSFR